MSHLGGYGVSALTAILKQAKDQILLGKIKERLESGEYTVFLFVQDLIRDKNSPPPLNFKY